MTNPTVKDGDKISAGSLIRTHDDTTFLVSKSSKLIGFHWLDMPAEILLVLEDFAFPSKKVEEDIDVYVYRLKTNEIVCLSLAWDDEKSMTLVSSLAP